MYRENSVTIFRPLFLLADNVLPWFVYVIITLETAPLDTPNKVAILVIDAPAKCAQSVLFENLRSRQLCSTFIQTVSKHNLLCIDTGTTQHKQFYSNTVYTVSIISPSPVDINSTICISCYSTTQINTQTGNHHHYNKWWIYHRHDKSY